jgi:hypothetical protein
MKQDAEKALTGQERRASTEAVRRGHAPAGFVDVLTKDAHGKPIAGRSAHCANCGGEILAMANGETSVPRLCRPS